MKRRNGAARTCCSGECDLFGFFIDGTAQATISGPNVPYCSNPDSYLGDPYFNVFQLYGVGRPGRPLYQAVQGIEGFSEARVSSFGYCPDGNGQEVQAYALFAALIMGSEKRDAGRYWISFDAASGGVVVGALSSNFRHESYDGSALAINDVYSVQLPEADCFSKAMELAAGGASGLYISVPPQRYVGEGPSSGYEISISHQLQLYGFHRTYTTRRNGRVFRNLASPPATVQLHLDRFFLDDPTGSTFLGDVYRRDKLMIRGSRTLPHIPSGQDETRLRYSAILNGVFYQVEIQDTGSVEVRIDGGISYGSLIYQVGSDGAGKGRAWMKGVFSRLPNSFNNDVIGEVTVSL